MIVNAGDTTQIRWEHFDPDDRSPVTPATVTVVLKAPNGTTTSPAVTHPATGASLLNVSTPTPGDWLLTWTSTSPDETDEIAIYAQPPGSSAPWEPTLRTVAGHVPDRTREVYSDNREAETFTSDTTPSADTVGVMIGTAVRHVRTIVGTPILADAYGSCLNAAALWAAYWVERSYPSDATNQAAQLRADAEAATAAAKAFNVGIGGGQDQQPDADGQPEQLVRFGGFDPAPDFPPVGSTAGRPHRIIL